MDAFIRTGQTSENHRNELHAFESTQYVVYTRKGAYHSSSGIIEKISTEQLFQFGKHLEESWSGRK